VIAAKLRGTFDASSVEPNAPLEPLPPGEYIAQIVQSEMRVTSPAMVRSTW
jgi:hypothetical protein